jgi:PAS domain S-box-containing protein
MSVALALDQADLHSMIDPHPLTIAVDTPVSSAIALMAASGSSYVLVIGEPIGEHRCLVGILTASDVVRLNVVRLSAPPEHFEQSIQAVMQHPVVTIPAMALTDIGAVLGLFQQHPGHYLPVLDETDRVVGVIQPDRLMAMLLDRTLRPTRQPGELELADQLADQLAESEAKFRRLVEGANDLIWSVNQAGQFTYLSPQFKSRFGWEPTAWLGRSFMDLLHPEDVSIMLANWQRLRSGGKSNKPEFRIRHGDEHDGHEHYVWVQVSSTTIINVAGEMVGNQGILSDITDRKEYEQRLERSNAELLRATRLKDEFLANMSHELRTPLNAVLGLSECLQDEILGVINQRQRKAIVNIESSAQHLLSLINDILSVSKIAAGKLTLEITPVPIVHLCTSSLAFIKQQAFTKQIHLTTNFSPDLGDMPLDERRMRQVLINLLSNAVKFTPDRGTVTLDVKRIDGAVLFAVIDTGIGIALPDQTQLFQPFVQIDSRLNRQYEGTGLGLALVKQIAELHGGSVSLTSHVGQGSCFAVRLPIPAGASTVVSLASTPRPALGSVEQATIVAPLVLLVEDNLANIHLFCGYLETKGYRLLLAEDGQTAIDLTQRHRPDLILMDIQMPGMDGLVAIQTIRHNPDVQLAAIPIVALTALAMAGDREKCLAAGASAYLAKPVKLKQLHATMQHLLGAVTSPDRI